MLPTYLTLKCSPFCPCSPVPPLFQWIGLSFVIMKCMRQQLAKKLARSSHVYGVVNLSKSRARIIYDCGLHLLRAVRARALVRRSSSSTANGCSSSTAAAAASSAAAWRFRQSSRIGRVRAFFRRSSSTTATGSMPSSSRWWCSQHPLWRRGVRETLALIVLALAGAAAPAILAVAPLYSMLANALAPAILA